MANDLTGDFDVVAEFSVPAVNRILAAMHQAERFFHSISLTVDDNPPPAGPDLTKPTLTGVADAFGDPIADHTQLIPPVRIPGPAAVTDPAYWAISPLLNPDSLVLGLDKPVPSHVQGRAQLQLFPPTIAVPSAPGNALTVRMNLMARFFPDPGSAPLAEFVRGDLQITAPVSQIVSEKMRMIDVDFKADQAMINFTPSWSSHPLSAGDLVGISRCIRNGLRTSFLPSSNPLPAYIAQLGFKTLPNAVAVLLDLNDHPSSQASVNNVFLSGGDDFALGVGRDFIFPLFSSALSNFQFAPVSVEMPIWGSATYTNSFTAPPSLELQDGAIVLTIQAHAHSNKSRFPSFNYTATVAFVLNLVPIDASGRLGTAEVALADVSLDFTDSGVEGWGKDLLLGLFRGKIIDIVNAVVNNVLNPPDPQPSDLQPTLERMLNVDTNLGDFLNALLIPPRNRLLAQPHELQLAYTSVEIRPSGVILHGSVSVLSSAPRRALAFGNFLPATYVGWPAPYVEFEQVPANSAITVANPITTGPDYTALKTWIPGGTIDQYEWSNLGQPNPFSVDPHKFVLVHSPEPEELAGDAIAAVRSYTSLCLTVRGTRIAPSGAEAYQPVSATVCGYSRVPVLPGGLISTVGGAVPALALTRRGKAGQVEVTGHAATLAGGNGSGTPNLLVHFADAKTATQLELLTQALAQSKRSDAATVVLAVLAPELLSKTPYVPGVTCTDAQAGAWERVFRVKPGGKPLTLIVGPKGNVPWQQAGAVDRDALAAALAKALVRVPPVKINMPLLNVRIGQLAPNFLFELAPGRELPLRKLSGKPVAIVFWRSSAPQSMQAVVDLQKTSGRTAKQPQTVLAVNDGENADLAQAAAARNGFAGNLVMDTARAISSAYGVDIWPTVVSLDASGLVTAIAYGHSGDGVSAPPSKQ